MKELKFGNIIKQKIAVFLVFTTALTFSLPSAVQGYEAPQPESFHQYLAQSVVHILTLHHYNNKQLNDEVASTLYEEYFNTLDPRRRFFLKSDIEEFASYRHLLDEHLQKGNLNFAFDVYERYVQRVAERVDYARERLSESFDFTKDETVLVDRKDCDWAESSEELDEVWRKLLKNQVLSYKIMEDEEGADEEDSGHGKGKELDDDPGDQESRSDDETDELDTQDDQTDTNEETDKNKEMEEVFIDLEKSPRKRVLHAQERFLDYLHENEPIDIVEKYISTLANIYDPHSSYMTPEMEEDFNISMSLSLEGIGAVLKQEQGYAKITEVMPGGPAAESGKLEPGDRIISVQQENEEPVEVINMPLEQVVRLIRGEKGTEVTLLVLKGNIGSSGVPTRITLTRDKVNFEEQRAKASLRNPDFSVVADAQDQDDDPEPGEEKRNGSESERVKPTFVTSEQGDKKFMLLKLESFYSDFEGRNNGNKDFNSASKDVKNLLQKAEKDDDVKGIVLDLRSNGGGSLEEAIKITGFFLEGGPIVQVKSANGNDKTYEDPDDEMVYSGPLVVLVNKLSASASEILAGAVKDYDRGIIMGSESTHGKGSVQMIMELDRIINSSPLFNDRKCGSLRLSTAKYYRVNGKSTQLKGVHPHIKFPTFTEKMELGEDNLDHPMDWDEIESLDFEPTEYVNPYLDVIKARSSKRLDDWQAFSEFTAAVDRFAAIQERREVTLSLDDRREQLRQEEQWLEKVREQTLQDRDELDDEGGDDGTWDGILDAHSESDENKSEEDAEDSKNDDEDKNDPLNKDLMVSEALRVLSDLYWLSSDENHEPRHALNKR
ncbi:MAG: carboxy terminal-processing peptidase [Lentisphaeria bacterium]